MLPGATPGIRCNDYVELLPATTRYDPVRVGHRLVCQGVHVLVHRVDVALVRDVVDGAVLSVGRSSSYRLMKVDS